MVANTKPMVFSRRLLMQTAVAGGVALWVGRHNRAMAQDGTAPPETSPPSTVAPTTGPHPIEDFFGIRGTVSVALSPSGDRFAILEQFGEPDKVQSKLLIFGTDNPEVPIRTIDLENNEVGWVHWSGNGHLLVKVVMKPAVRRYRPMGTNRRVSVEGYPTERIVSVNVDARSMAVMFQSERERLRYSPYLAMVTDFLPDDPDHILMSAYEADNAMDLYKVEVATGRATRVERGTQSTVGWVTHEGVPVMRRHINARGSVETWYARLGEETEWRLARRTRIREAPDFSYLGRSGAQDSVRVIVRNEGENYQSVRDMNLRDLQFSDPIGPREGKDAIGGAYDSRGQWLGVEYYGERLEYEFEDKALAAHHRALNQYFDNDCDVHLTDVSGDGNRIIAYVVGPRDPGLWVYYDRAARTILPLGSRIHLEPERLAPTRRLDVPTRDGAQIEAYLTAPLSNKPGPLVVLPHGGPEVRDYRSFDHQVQILAAQGWWVLQPNFRGSGGYGADFAKAGWRRWDSRMQEDVEDAVAQVLSDYSLDADRVAIMGTSYGGYAALMGAVRRPELYKAAISICGVSDLNEMLQWEKRTDDTPGKMIFEIWTNRIGNLDTDRELIRRGSPRLRVAEIHCPVLLVHGTQDEIVPVNQSQIMERALRQAGKRVEYVPIEGGHADWDGIEEMGLMKRYVALLTEVFA